MRLSKLAFALPLVLIAFGCGGKSDQPKSALVKGKVMLGNSPLDSGKIFFEGEPGLPGVELEIKNGVYEGQVTVGTKTVRITAMKYAPAPVGMAGQPGYEKGIEQNYLPAKYNTASKFVHEVKEKGPNEFDFTVTSK